MYYNTWTCPHCHSVWSFEAGGVNSVCRTVHCHATNLVYRIVYDRVSCLMCDKNFLKTCKLPVVYTQITTKNETFRTAEKL